MNRKSRDKKVIIGAILTFALLSSAFFVFSNSATVKAQTTLISSNMLQYEWIQPAADPERSFFSAGPAPNAPNIQWKAKMPGLEGLEFHYSGMTLTAFNGLVFASVPGLKAYGQDYTDTFYAFDGTTGALVWKREGMSGNAIKLDNTYMVVGNKCIKIADGADVWVGPEGFSNGGALVNGVGYVPELKMFLDGTRGWNLPDPSKPPTLAWDLKSTQDVGTGFFAAPVYGEGKLYIGNADNFLRAYDAKTATLLWKAPAKAQFNYGMSYGDGKVFHGGLDGNVMAWDADTGELLWSYNPGTWYGQWASSSGYAYGMIYEHNQDNYIYAINATNGQLVRRQKGPGIWYSNMLVIADGKVYCQMGEKEYRDFDTGKFGESEFDCFDAYTGKLLWTLPVENGAPFNFQCIAYGNLYIAPTVSENTPGVFFGSRYVGELWCISSTTKDWNMFLSDPSHSAEGAGPTNLALKWKYETGATIKASPTLVNGVCYIGSTDEYIYALDSATGGKKWSFKTGFAVKSTVAVVNGRLYSGADDGNVYCLDAVTGKQIWKTPAGGITNCIISDGLGAAVRSSPMVLNDRVYVGSLDSNLYCLNAKDGSVIWKFKTTGAILATPTIYNNEIFVPSCNPGTNGDFYKLDLNGNVLWHKEIPYVLDKTWGAGAYLYASATVAPDLGYVFLRNGQLLNYAMEISTGNIVWTYSGRFNPGTPGQLGGVIQQNAMLYKYGKVYFNDFYGIVCLDAKNGSEVWYAYLSRENLAPGFAYAYGRVYTVDEVGVLYVLDAITGEKLSYHEFGTIQMHAAPSLYNGNLYVAMNDWCVYCFGEARLVAASNGAQPTGTPTSINSQSPSPSVPLAVPTEVLYAVAIVAVVVIAAVAAILLQNENKPHRQKSTPFPFFV